MKTNKKIILLLCLVGMTVLTLCLSSCNNTPENDKYSIVCTIFPEYDFIMNILGDKSADFEVTMLLGNGTDMHSYQPTIADLAKISECDMFVYVGSQSQSWSSNVLKNVDREKTKVISKTIANNLF